MTRRWTKKEEMVKRGELYALYVKENKSIIGLLSFTNERFSHILDEAD